MENKNKPEIRFKGFDDDWGKYELQDLSEIIDGDRGRHYPSFNEFYLEGHTLFLSATNVTKNGFNFQENQYITFEKSNILGNGKLETNDIVLTSRGSIGHIAWYKDHISKVYPHIRINSGMLILRSINGTQPIYLNQFLKSSLGKNAIDRITFGSAQPQLTKKEVSRLKITIPNQETEQKIIGSFFENIDKLIAQQQQKHSKLKVLKKAMLDKMFPKQGQLVPEIRFKGFDGEWVEKKLGDEVDFFTGLTYSPFDVVKSNGTFVIRSSNVKNGKLVDADNVYVNSSKVNCDFVKKYDIAVVVRNGSRDLIGKHAQIKSTIDNAVIGAFMTGLRSETPNFINALLDSQQFKNEINKNLGATINQITTGNFKEMIFLFPKKLEQRKIGEYFYQIDELINNYGTQITKLQNIKKAFLAKMFI